jgi:nuclear pore complex protein Nup205
MIYFIVHFVSFIYSDIGFGNQSKFDVKVHRQERLLRKGIVSYIGGASEFTGKSINSRIDPNS